MTKRYLQLPNMVMDLVVDCGSDNLVKFEHMSDLKRLFEIWPRLSPRVQKAILMMAGVDDAAEDPS